jgi:hypothetical protein
MTVARVTGVSVMRDAPNRIDISVISSATPIAVGRYPAEMAINAQHPNRSETTAVGNTG